MGKQRVIEWFTLDDRFDSVGEFPLETTYEGGYVCPKCGKPAEYWEGTFDQDRMGNDIQGWSYDCFHCGIGTSVEEL